MAEKKKKRDKNSGRKGTEDGVDSNKLTKDEDAIARFLRFNCPTNSTMFEGNEVHYFSGKKAIDVLVESKKYGATAKTPKFLNSDSAEEFLQTLLAKGLFFRAKKLVPKKKEKTSSEQQQKGEKSGRDVSKSPSSAAKSAAGKRQRKEAEEVTEGTNEEKGEEDRPKEEEDEEEDQQQEKREAKEEEKRRKKKVKLLFHDVQTFDVSSSDVYVWVFDPTPLWKKCVGILIVLGTIGGCLFPLWPDWLRLGIYYLSVIGIALFGLLLGVAFARTILFGLIWLFTLGRYRIWLLPNLLEECGFFESFHPVYTYEYVSGGIFARKEKKNKKKGVNEVKKESQKKGEEEEQQQNDSTNRGEEAAKGEEKGDEKAPLLPQENHGEASLPKDEEKLTETADAIQATDNGENEDEPNCNSRAESESTSSSKKGGTSGSEEEGEEGAQTGTDDSNSWEKLSENSHQSAECGKKAL